MRPQDNAHQHRNNGKTGRAKHEADGANQKDYPHPEEGKGRSESADHLDHRVWSLLYPHRIYESRHALLLCRNDRDENAGKYEKLQTLSEDRKSPLLGAHSRLVHLVFTAIYRRVFSCCRHI